MHQSAGVNAPKIAPPRCGFCWSALRGKVCHICRTPEGKGGDIPPERRRAVDAYCRTTYGADFATLRIFAQSSASLSELAVCVAAMPGCSSTDARFMASSLHMLRRLARPDEKLRRAMQRSGLLP